MPVPQVTCSVCGILVNKARTLSIGDGKRACREHEETSQLAIEVQQKIEEKHQAGRTSLKPKFSSSKPTDPIDSIPPPHCVVCNKKGITKEQLNYSLEEDWGKPVPSLMLLLAAVAYQKSGRVLLSLVDPSTLGKLPPNAELFGLTFGFVPLCMECLAQIGIKTDQTPPK